MKSVRGVKYYILTKLFHESQWQYNCNGYNDHKVVPIQEPFTAERHKDAGEQRENEAHINKAYKAEKDYLISPWLCQILY